MALLSLNTVNIKTSENILCSFKLAVLNSYANCVAKDYDITVIM